MAKVGSSGARRVAPVAPPRGALDAAIGTALTLLQAGQAGEAIACLDAFPPGGSIDAKACSLAGLILAGAAAPRRAIAWFDRALALRAGDATLLGHRANARVGAGDVEGAVADYERAVAAGASDPVLHYDRGNLLRSLGRLPAAIESYDAALHLRPAYPEALRAGGAVLRELGHAAGALRFFGEALRLKPDDVDAWLDCTNLLQAGHRYDEALAAYDRALAACPGDALLLTNRGIALLEVGRLEEGVASLEDAGAADPRLPQAPMNRGNALVWLGRPAEALAAYDRALALRPLYPEASCGRGLALKQLGRLDQALAAYEAALAQRPDFAHALANRGELQLLQGDFAAGWPDYEFRFLAGRQERPVLAAPVPFWTGAPIAGARLAVFADQGHGDKIQFARYLPLLTLIGASVTLVCPPRLQRLLQGLTQGLRVVSVVEDGETFDVQVALSSLPFCFRTARDTIPAPTGYLVPEPALVELWAARLGSNGLRVGLCWRGHQGWQVDPRRSVPLPALAPLAAIPGLRLISLQLPDNDDATGANPAALRIEPFGEDLDTGPDAFVDTAALMASLDLIVTCDTSIAHLAGALGRPTFVLLQASPEWRWMLGTPVSPWYGGVRLFRQTRAGAWQDPVAALTRAVADWPRIDRSPEDKS